MYLLCTAVILSIFRDNTNGVSVENVSFHVAWRLTMTVSSECKHDRAVDFYKNLVTFSSTHIKMPKDTQGDATYFAYFQAKSYAGCLNF